LFCTIIHRFALMRPASLIKYQAKFNLLSYRCSINRAAQQVDAAEKWICAIFIVVLPRFANGMDYGLRFFGPAPPTLQQNSS
jgi:hypothetical protein